MHLVGFSLWIRQLNVCNSINIPSGASVVFLSLFALRFKISSYPPPFCVQCTSIFSHTHTHACTHTHTHTVAEAHIILIDLTNSMDQSTPSSANSCSASQDIPRILWNSLSFITSFTTLRDLSRSSARSIQSMSPQSHFSKLHFNIILPSTPRSPKWTPSLTYPHQNAACTSPVSHTCHRPCPYHSSRIYHPNNICRGVLHRIACTVDAVHQNTQQIT